MFRMVYMCKTKGRTQFILESPWKMGKFLITRLKAFESIEKNFA